MTADLPYADPAGTKTGSPFDECLRLDARVESSAVILAAIRDHCYVLHEPIVISHCLEAWSLHTDLLSTTWLQQALGSESFMPFNMNTKTDAEPTTYADYMTALEGQCETLRTLYAKDLPCPAAWADHLRQRLPDPLFYGSKDDLMAQLPSDMQVDNLMIYIGSSGTYTPAHTDLCGSIGHNLMVNATQGSYALWHLIRPADREAADRYWQLYTRGTSSIALENFYMPAEQLAKAPFRVIRLEQRPGDFLILPGDCAHQVHNAGRGYNVKVSWNRPTIRSLPYAVDTVLPFYQHALRPDTYRIKALGYHALISLRDRAERFRQRDNDPSSWVDSGEVIELTRELRDLIACVQDYVVDEWIVVQDVRILQGPDRGQPKSDGPTGLNSADHLLPGATWTGVDETDLAIHISPGSTRPIFDLQCDFCRTSIWLRGFHCPECAIDDSEAADSLHASLARDPALSSASSTSGSPALLPADGDRQGFDLCSHCYALGRSCQHPCGMQLMEFVPIENAKARINEAIQTYNDLIDETAAAFARLSRPGDLQRGLDYQPLPTFNPTNLAAARSHKTPMTVAYALWRQRQLALTVTCTRCGDSRVPVELTHPGVLVRSLFSEPEAPYPLPPSVTIPPDAPYPTRQVPAYSWAPLCLFCQLGFHMADHFYLLSLRLPYYNVPELTAFSSPQQRPDTSERSLWQDRVVTLSDDYLAFQPVLTWTLGNLDSVVNGVDLDRYVTALWRPNLSHRPDSAVDLTSTGLSDLCTPKRTQARSSRSGTPAPRLSQFYEHSTTTDAALKKRNRQKFLRRCRSFNQACSLHITYNLYRDLSYTQGNLVDRIQYEMAARRVNRLKGNPPMLIPPPNRIASIIDGKCSTGPVKIAELLPLMKSNLMWDMCTEVFKTTLNDSSPTARYANPHLSGRNSADTGGRALIPGSALSSIIEQAFDFLTLLRIGSKSHGIEDEIMVTASGVAPLPHGFQPPCMAGTFDNVPDTPDSDSLARLKPKRPGKRKRKAIDSPPVYHSASKRKPLGKPLPPGRNVTTTTAGTSLPPDFYTYLTPDLPPLTLDMETRPESMHVSDQPTQEQLVDSFSFLYAHGCDRTLDLAKTAFGDQAEELLRQGIQRHYERVCGQVRRLCSAPCFNAMRDTFLEEAAVNLQRQFPPP
ncbi:hypothetical protein IWQ60_000042 [Tieghemiomyces parasiticus]|uniref:JmjC domain-containing protein n=1 Tax=Tieghemiomyces parasiticus TaxID=78921 RepID=A0A9W8AGQ3_9FUNG|nr:hypothetical protein IWQ60_000042 [Tieghemiomyces parasiticus]